MNNNKKDIIQKVYIKTITNNNKRNINNIDMISEIKRKNENNLTEKIRIFYSIHM